MPTTQTKPMKPTALRDPRRFTLSEYYRLAEAGILGEDDRVELIEGYILPMSPIGSRHATCVRRVCDLFYAQARAYAIISVQSPIRLDDRSEPEPDLALLVRSNVYAERHPLPDEVLLVIEVAETSIDFDRNVKLPLYARAGIPEVWIVNLEAEQVEVYRQPGPKGYAESATFGPGDEVQVTALPEAEAFAVDAMLGA